MIYNLKFTEQDLLLLSKALGLLPYAEVTTLIANLQAQVDSHKKEDNANS